MFSITITDSSGERTVRTFGKPDVTIGREKSNDVVLMRGNVSKQHARVLYNRGAFVVVDNKSTNGTFVNGQRIDAPYVLGPTDKIIVGDFVLEVAAGVREDAEPVRTKGGRRRPVAPAEPGSNGSDKGTDKSGLPKSGLGSAVAVDWAENWDDAIDLGASPPPAGALDGDLDFEPPAATTDDPQADGEPIAGIPERRASRISFASGATAAELARCLGEYVDLDAYYRARALGGDCACGTCLLCRARRALADFEAGG